MQNFYNEIRQTNRTRSQLNDHKYNPLNPILMKNKPSIKINNSLKIVND